MQSQPDFDFPPAPTTKAYSLSSSGIPSAGAGPPPQQSCSLLRSTDNRIGIMAMYIEKVFTKSTTVLLYHMRNVGVYVIYLSYLAMIYLP